MGLVRLFGTKNKKTANSAFFVSSYFASNSSDYSEMIASIVASFYLNMTDLVDTKVLGPVGTAAAAGDVTVLYLLNRSSHVL